MTKLIIGLALFISTSAFARQVHIVSTDAKIDITTSKVVFLTGDVRPKLLNRFRKQMAATEDLPGDRVVIINSPGGSVRDGNEMIAMIEAEKKNETRVVCLVMQYAHSMAFNFLSHCDVRLATANARMLVHKVAMYEACKEDQARCTARRLRLMADELDFDDEPYRYLNSLLMGLSIEDYDLYADKETTWLAKTLRGMKYLHGIGTRQQ